MGRKKSKKRSGKKLSARQLQSEIVKLFKRQPKKRFNPKQIASKLKIANSPDSVADALDKLAEEEKILAIPHYKYQINRNHEDMSDRKMHQGYVDMTRSGSAYIVCEDLEDDVHVPVKRMNNALHGDLVKIAVWTPRGRRRAEGEVLEVIERATEHFLGTLRTSKNYAIVIPDRMNMPTDIFVHTENMNGGKDGDKVVVKITKWPTRYNHSPEGEVTAVLGPVGSNDIEMKAILINHGFELEFTKEVMMEANSLPDTISEEDIADRLDLRDVTTFTIDPDDAKDFDDALSIRYDEKGRLEVGVHIADVSHYVRPDTALDQEAYSRSTSVYLVDRVLPMLPERLSNELCSLRPNEDKLTFSAIFTFSKNNKIAKKWFGRTIIHSDRRFTYGQAQEVLETGKGDYAEELRTLNDLAKNLRIDRFRHGSIDFDVDEVRFRLNEEGVPIEVYVKERKDAHMLIEDFMLLANREVAFYIAEKGQHEEVPFVYRIHDEPDPDKVAEFVRFAAEMNVDIKADSPEQIAQAYNRLTDMASTDDAIRILEPLAIRTMAKAEYNTDNIGHYGLGFEHYTHFTSPIRRYSDVLVHRVLAKNLGSQTWRTDKAELQEQCTHISTQERRAMDAERESIKYKQVEFMKNHIGDVFDGYISGIIDRGIFVEVKGNKCEGMVGFDTLNEPFEIENGRLRARGLRSNKLYKMGDLVKIRIITADLAKRRIEMEFAEE